MPTTLTKTVIATHERLHPRLAALLKQVERVAGKRPGEPVPEETLKLSQTLIREAAKLLGREGRGISAPKGSSAAGKAALDHQNLAVALGQALAGLEAFEGTHTVLAGGVRSWQLGDGTRQPVARLLAKTSARGATTAPAKPDFGFMGRTASEARQKLYSRMIERENLRYMQGYRDAKAGKDPIPPLDKVEPVPHGGNAG